MMTSISTLPLMISNSHTHGLSAGVSQSSTPMVSLNTLHRISLKADTVQFGRKKASVLAFGMINGVPYKGPTLLMDPGYLQQYINVTTGVTQPPKSFIEQAFEADLRAVGTSPHKAALYLSEGGDKDKKDPTANVVLKYNQIPIEGPVSDEMNNMVRQRAQLLVSAMKKTGKVKPVNFYINSPGGSVLAMYGILDTMDQLKNTKIEVDGEEKPITVATYVHGYAASAATLISSNGTPGNRFISPRSEFMIHQPLSGTHGQVTDMVIGTKHALKAKKFLISFFAEKTKMPEKWLKRTLERDYWMSTPDEVVKRGFVDAIVDQYTSPNMVDLKGGDLRALGEIGGDEEKKGCGGGCDH